MLTVIYDPSGDAARQCGALKKMFMCAKTIHNWDGENLRHVTDSTILFTDVPPEPNKTYDVLQQVTGGPIYQVFNGQEALAILDKWKPAEKDDPVNHPGHYTRHPSGVECIQITEHMNFNNGNAVKYIWRADLKHDDGGLEDLKKAQFYIAREIARRGAI